MVLVLKMFLFKKRGHNCDFRTLRGMRIKIGIDILENIQLMSKQESLPMRSLIN